MQTDRVQTSSTAETMAVHRAAENLLPEKDRVCHDPYAVHFVSKSTMDNMKRPLRRRLFGWLMSRLYPGVHGAVVARVRFIDDHVNECLEKGLEQLVILGTGYDTRAYRLEKVRTQCRVFELDNPGTQQRKKDIVKSIFNELPRHVRYLPLTIGIGNLHDILEENGYDEEKSTLFIMEGVIMYLAPEVVDELLAFIRNHAGQGSSIVFDYLPPEILDGTISAREGRRMYKHVNRMGEPFLFGLEHQAMESFLSARGFHDIRNVAATECRSLYFNGSSRNRPISSIFSFVSAQVRGNSG